MNFFSVSSILILVSNSIIAIFVLGKGKEKKISFLWALFCFLAAFWGLAGYRISTIKLQEVAFFWWQIAYISIILSPIFYLHFVFTFLNFKKIFLLLFSYILAAIFLVIIFSNRDLFFGNLRFVFNQFYLPDWTKLRSPYFIVFYVYFYWILLTYAFFLLVINYKYSTGLKRQQLRYFIVASIVGWVGAHGIFLPYFKINIYPYSNLLIAIYPLFISYAIIKYRLMDIRVFITRTVAFLIAYPFLLSIPFILGYKLYPILSDYFGWHWWLVPSGLLAVIATIAPLAYAQLRQKMESRLLAEQKRYQKLLLQAAGGMVTEHDLGKLAKLIVYIVKRIVKIRFAAIFLDDKREGIYRLKAMRDTGTNPYENVSFLYEHPFVDFIKKNREPFFFDEIPQQLRESMPALSGLNLIVPSAIEDNLLGFVFLGEKLNRQPYSEDDINVFKILSHQSALAVENCLFLVEFKQAQERIFTAEKLASIGGMADGVAHQIKNRLNQFSVASGELKYEIRDFLEKHPDYAAKDPDFKKSFDYMAEIADSLIRNVKKTDGIIKGILNFARVEEKETFFSKFSLREVTDLSLELLRVKHEVAEVPLELNLDSSDEIYGVKSQITESIYNLLDNAYEAVQERKQSLSEQEREHFVPKIVLKLVQKPDTHLIEITDNGIGIRRQDERKIFAPFFTTKSSYKSGTGIGMYVVKRMVEENHKGKVWFASRPMEGTSFFIELPKK